MQSDRIKDVIATRRLSLLNSNEAEIQVLLGKPEISDSYGYYCQFQIEGIGSGQIKYAKGLDAIEALQGALFLIGVDLDFLNKSLGNMLRWEGHEEGDLGFPTSDRRT